MTWLGKSILAMFLFCPFIIFTSMFGRHYNIKPESTMIYWFTGTVIGMFIWLVLKNNVGILELSKHLAIIGIIGLLTGSIANLLVIQSLMASDNPALPIAIVGSNAVVIYIISPALAYLMPRYFSYIKFDLWSLVGIILTVGGLFIIAFRQGR